MNSEFHKRKARATTQSAISILHTFYQHHALHSFITLLNPERSNRQETRQTSTMSRWTRVCLLLRAVKLVVRACSGSVYSPGLWSWLSEHALICHKQEASVLHRATETIVSIDSFLDHMLVILDLHSWGSQGSSVTDTLQPAHRSKHVHM